MDKKYKKVSGKSQYLFEFNKTIRSNEATTKQENAGSRGNIRPKVRG
jgi:hypothetical protein